MYFRLYHRVDLIKQVKLLNLRMKLFTALVIAAINIAVIAQNDQIAPQAQPNSNVVEAGRKLEYIGSDMLSSLQNNLAEPSKTEDVSTENMSLLDKADENLEEDEEENVDEEELDEENLEEEDGDEENLEEEDDENLAEEEDDENLTEDDEDNENLSEEDVDDENLSEDDEDGENLEDEDDIMEDENMEEYNLDEDEENLNEEEVEDEENLADEDEDLDQEDINLTDPEVQHAIKLSVASYIREHPPQCKPNCQELIHEDPEFCVRHKNHKCCKVKIAIAIA